MRLDIRYRTVFDYEEPVHDSHNEVRACPADTLDQRVVAYELVVSPAAVVQSFRDYWGTRVDVFGIEQRHRRLTIEARCSVRTEPVPPIDDAPRLADVRDEVALTHTELLLPSRHTELGDEALAALRAHVPDDATTVETADLLAEAVREHVDYRLGSTDVGVALDEVWSQKAGVCQDFTHLHVAACRAVGLPARYVSGYLYTEPADVGEAEDGPVDVQTHAWVEVAVDRTRWTAVDPTNGRDVGIHHIKIGHGRDYDDVAPLHGAFFGGGDHRVSAAVEIRQAGGMPSAADRGLLPRHPGGGQ